MRAILFYCLLAFSLISCRYDEDFAFVPSTLSAYILAEDNGQHKLLKIDKNFLLNPLWGEGLGLSNPSDIAGNVDQLWVSVASEGSLHLIDLETEQLEASYDLGGFRADYLAMGSKYLFMGDSAQKQIGFFDLKKRKLISQSIMEKPGKAVYRSTKFFMIYGDQEVAIYQEDALAPVAVLDFGREVWDLVLDNRFRTWVFSKDSLRYRATIDWNSNSIEEEETQINISKLRQSPYLRANFGKEYISSIGISENRLTNFPSPLADDFEVDFFESRIYFTYIDSLYRLDIRSREINPVSAFSGTFKNSYFYQNTEER